jgi:hypothetical protein
LNASTPLPKIAAGWCASGRECLGCLPGALEKEASLEAMWAFYIAQPETLQ